MGGHKIPDRWLLYSPMGSVISGTRFIACKVPLKDGLIQSLPEKERFGPKHLFDAFPKIGLLVDLTNTMRYYSKQEFMDKNIRYEKIFCPGRVVPPNSIVKQFFRVVDDYLASEHDPDAVIVVHCTHGVNRTGYFICRYMIERLNMSPEEALKNFQMARGHGIERDNYVSDLQNGCKGGDESDLRVLSNRDFRRDRKTVGRRQIHNSRRGFRGAVYDQHNQIPAKRQTNDYNPNSNDYYPNEKWNKQKRRQNHFTYFDGKPNPEKESNLSYNWRDHRNNKKTPFPSTVPLPQFTPVYPQGSSIPSHQLPSHCEQTHSGVSYEGRMHHQRGNFTGAPPKRFRDDQGFVQIPKYCHPETSNEAEPSSRLTEVSISDPDNSYYASERGALPSSGFRGNFRGRASSMGNSRGNWRDRGRGNRNGRGNRQSSGNRRNEHKRNDHSRK